jgi:hypothetical protein
MHSTHFLGILQPLVLTESNEIKKKKGRIEKFFKYFFAYSRLFSTKFKKK